MASGGRNAISKNMKKNKLNQIQLESKPPNPTSYIWKLAVAGPTSAPRVARRATSCPTIDA
eukprot:7964877-Heterocapsa_arctica.AAC.1